MKTKYPFPQNHKKHSKHCLMQFERFTYRVIQNFKLQTKHFKIKTNFLFFNTKLLYICNLHKNNKSKIINCNL